MQTVQWGKKYISRVHVNSAIFSHLETVFTDIVYRSSRLQIELENTVNFINIAIINPEICLNKVRNPPPKKCHIHTPSPHRPHTPTPPPAPHTHTPFCSTFWKRVLQVHGVIGPRLGHLIASWSLEKATFFKWSNIKKKKPYSKAKSIKLEVV